MHTVWRWYEDEWTETVEVRGGMMSAPLGIELEGSKRDIFCWVLRAYEKFAVLFLHF